MHRASETPLTTGHDGDHATAASTLDHVPAPPAPGRAPGSTAAASPRSRAIEGGFRPDIEGLRAVAVVLVLLYHAHLGPFSGGYIGVDVFYVLSGFLITSLLLRELGTRGRIRLPNFWARRARRLLPASCLVIVATLVAGHYMLNPLAQRDLAHDALAAVLFVVNIVFAHRQGNYLTATAAPSPLLNFWSLAVEEQFYLFWPLLIVLAARWRRHQTAAVGLLVAIIWPVSLIACIWLTNTNQPWAFYSLPTRAWELATGAALALVATRVARLPEWTRALAGWAGLAAVLAASVLYSDLTKFPGVAAMVPVLGTMALVAAGAARLAPAGALRWSPLQWIGRRSYAIYLWHWPMLVLIDAKWGPLDPWQRGLVVLASIGVSAISFQILEDPVRHSRWLAGKARRGLALGGGLIGVGVIASILAVAATPSLVGSEVAAAPTLVAPPSAAPTAPATVPGGRGSSTTGATKPGSTAPSTTTSPSAAAVLGPQQLAAANAAQLVAAAKTSAAPANLKPSVGTAGSDLPIIYNNGCQLDASVTQPPPCVFGDPNGTKTVALFGDSHAAEWFPALNQVAIRNHWRLIALTKKGCPTADIPVFSPMVNRQLTECGPWRKNVAARLATEHPDLIVMSSYRYRQTGSAAGVDPNVAWQRGLSATLDVLRPLATNVLILGDTPTPKQDVPNCVSGHLRSLQSCMNSRATAVREDRLAVERAVAATYKATFVTTGDWLCTPTQCPVVIGDILVYRDDNHLTATASEWLAPYIEAATKPLMGS